MPKRVLVVEDDAPLRRVYRIALLFAGFDVQEAADGLQALTLIDEHPPDLVVLDLMLPRLNGHDVQKEIAARAETRHIAIVVVTGSTDHVDGPCVLRKPISPDVLVDTVRFCLAHDPRG